MRRATAWSALALTTALLGCGKPEQVAGGTSSEVPNALNGQIVDQQGRPVADAAVRVVPSSAWADSGLVLDSARTDSAGRWFISVPTGSWSVVAQGPAGWSMRSGYPDGVRYTDTLRSPVWVTGSVGAGFAHAQIWMRGTTLTAVTDSTGSFFFGPLPSGQLRLHLRADSTSLDGSVHADPGEVVSTGTWLSAFWGQEDYSLWPSARTALIDLSATGANVQGDEPLFPVPVLLDSVLDVRSTDPVSLRFDDGQGVPYPYSLAWDSSGGHALAWVRLDTANGSSAKHLLRVLWGRHAPVPADMPQVFSSSAHFLGAWHCDSATETSSGISLRWTGSSKGTGVVGNARVLAGSGSWSTDSVTLGGTNSWTISLWVRMDAPPTASVVLAGFSGGQDSADWGISLRSSDDHVRVWSGSNSSDDIVSDSALKLSTWTHLVATFDSPSNRIGLVIDTAAYPRKTVTFPTASRQSIQGGIGLAGAIDEIRFSDTARTTQWSQLERQTQIGVPWLRW
jgi:hypothetical protein